MDRRLFLTASVAAGVAALGGCAAIGGPDSDERPPPPSFDDPAVGDTWERFDAKSEVAFEESVGPVTVTATQQTVALENVALRTELREKTLDGIDARLGIAFATRIDVDPPLDQLPAGIGRAELMASVEDAGVTGFEEQLAASGIEDVRQVGEATITTDRGDEITATEYEGTVTFDDVSFQVTDDTSITLEGDDVLVSGWLAAWHDGAGPLVAGGVHPGENFARSVEESLTEGIHVRLDVDLGFDPAAYRAEVFDILGSVR